MSSSEISIVRGQDGDVYLQQYRDDQTHRMLSSVDQIEALVQYVTGPNQGPSGSTKLPGPNDTSILIRVLGCNGSFSVAQGSTCIYGGNKIGRLLADSWEQFVFDDEPIDLAKMGAERRSARRNPPGSTNCFAIIATAGQPPITALVSDISQAGAGLIVEDIEGFDALVPVKVTYELLELKGKIINRMPLPGGKLRLGVCWEKPSVDASEGDDRSELHRRYLIFVRQQDNEILLEQYRMDACSKIAVTETQLADLVQFLTSCPKHKTSSLELGGEVSANWHARDSSFSIHEGNEVIYGYGDIRHHLHCA